MEILDKGIPTDSRKWTICLATSRDDEVDTTVPAQKSLILIGDGHIDQGVTFSGVSPTTPPRTLPESFSGFTSS